MMYSVDSSLDPQTIRLHVRWPRPSSAPASVNQFLTQISPDPDGGPGEILVTLGHAGPPRLTGSLEQIKEQAEALSAIEVTPAAYVSLTQSHAKQLRDILQATLEKWDQALKLNEEGGRK
jgi:hypothetical protein